MRNETNVKRLIEFCHDEMETRDYSEDYKCRVSKAWDGLTDWMKHRQYSEFSPDIGHSFLDEKVGVHRPGKNLIKSQQVCVRAVRMLISLQTMGCIEDHPSDAGHRFTGPVGALIQQYLDHMANKLKRKESTVKNTEAYLFRFYSFLNAHGYGMDDINFEVMETFHSEQGYTPGSYHNCAGCIRRFLRFLHASGFCEQDRSVFVAPDNYRIKEGNLPSAYSEEEIRAVLSSVDRASVIGKRDYLILILAAEYGWRNGDIRQFRLDQIDWEKNEIRFLQQKGGNPVVFPLLASVGNAIIDYLKNGRPSSEASEVILSVKPSRKSKPLSAPAVSGIAAKYFGQSGLAALNDRHKGTHAFRHSLASNMLGQEVPLPVISDVLGHRSIETTRVYLKVDVHQLKKCALPMPENQSPFYRRGGIWL